MSSPDIAAMEHALYDGRTLIRHHAMRRTLWVMSPHLARAAHAGFTRKIVAAERHRSTKIFEHDEDWIDRGIRRIVGLVEEAGRPVSTRELGELAPDLAVTIEVRQGRSTGRIALHSRFLLLAAMDGAICRARPPGSWIGSHYAWESNDRWMQIDWGRHGELTGATIVIDRWLRQFGPGTLTDLAWWTGGTKTLVRQALEAVEAEPVMLESGEGYVHPGHEVPPDPGPWVGLLPGLDPTPMGWKQRSWYLPDEVAARVVDRNGNIGPTVWLDGRVVGGWAQRQDGTIAHDVDTTALNHTHRQLLGVEIDRLRETVGDSRFSVRFPSPNQKTLLG